MLVPFHCNATFPPHGVSTRHVTQAEFVEKTNNEAGCIYYGWTIDGDKLFCREAYVDGAAANAHLANVGSCIGAILAEGVCTLDSINIMGLVVRGVHGLVATGGGGVSQRSRRVAAPGRGSGESCV